MEVAVAVIYDDANRILITRRGLDKSHGGLWEFPGGKIEPGESPVAALKREIKEEVGLEITQVKKLTEVSHRYPKHEVKLVVFSVHSYNGWAKCCESQMDLKWVEPKDLHTYEFPAANQFILNHI